MNEELLYPRIATSKNDFFKVRKSTIGHNEHASIAKFSVNRRNMHALILE